MFFLVHTGSVGLVRRPRAHSKFSLFCTRLSCFLSYYCCLNGPVVLFSLYLALASCLPFEGLLLREKITIKQHSQYTNKLNPGLFH